MKSIELRLKRDKDKGGVSVRIRGTEFFDLYSGKEELRQRRKEIDQILLFIDPKNATDDRVEDLEEVNREAPRFARDLEKFIFKGQSY